MRSTLRRTSSQALQPTIAARAASRPAGSECSANPSRDPGTEPRGARKTPGGGGGPPGASPATSYSSTVAATDRARNESGSAACSRRPAPRAAAGPRSARPPSRMWCRDESDPGRTTTKRPASRPGSPRWNSKPKWESITERGSDCARAGRRTRPGSSTSAAGSSGRHPPRTEAKTPPGFPVARPPSALTVWIPGGSAVPGVVR